MEPHSHSDSAAGDRDARDRIKRVIVREMFVEGIGVDDIGDEQILFGEGDALGLDSIDALQLVLGLEQEFGVKIDTNTLDRSRLATVASMSAFVAELQEGGGEAKMPGHR